MSVLDSVLAAIRAYSFSYASEDELQAGLTEALAHAGLDPVREVIITGGRIDIIVGRVGIEVKTKGSTADLRRQIERYTAERSLDAFVVVTARSQHSTLPAEIGGKPVTVVSLLGAM